MSLEIKKQKLVRFYTVEQAGATFVFCVAIEKAGDIITVLSQPKLLKIIRKQQTYVPCLSASCDNLLSGAINLVSRRFYTTRQYIQTAIGEIYALGCFLARPPTSITYKLINLKLT